jgi:hypothetical protein
MLTSSALALALMAFLVSALQAKRRVKLPGLTDAPENPVSLILKQR